MAVETVPMDPAQIERLMDQPPNSVAFTAFKRQREEQAERLAARLSAFLPYQGKIGIPDSNGLPHVIRGLPQKDEDGTDGDGSGHVIFRQAVERTSGYMAADVYHLQKQASVTLYEAPETGVNLRVLAETR